MTAQETDRYNAIISQLPLAAQAFPALTLAAQVEWLARLPVLEIRPRGADTFPVIVYDDVFKDRPQVGIYHTWNQLHQGAGELRDLPDNLDGSATAAILVAIADHAFRHSPYNTPAF